MLQVNNILQCIPFIMPASQKVATIPNNVTWHFDNNGCFNQSSGEQDVIPLPYHSTIQTGRHADSTSWINILYLTQTNPPKIKSQKNCFL